MRKTINRLKYNLDFLRVYNSPFKPLKLKFYIGKIAVGTPYFLPRKWVKIGKKEAIKLALKRTIPEHIDKGKQEVIFKSYVDNYIGSRKPIPKKIGFDFVGLGWKTKWDSYRFEWAPTWSFVFFKWQVAIIFIAPEKDQYWECWLEYDKETNKANSIEERIKQARKLKPCIWTSKKDGIKTEVCYWDLILKEKYL